MRIWAKVTRKDKVKRDIIYSTDMPLNEDNFQAWLYEICDKLDIPTPVLLPNHFLNFVRFHNCRFYEGDFVERFSYDRFILEDCND